MEDQGGHLDREESGGGVDSFLRDEYMETWSFDVVACIAAYMDEETIASVFLRVKDYVDLVIVCDDGSSDMTAEIAKNLGAVVLRHSSTVGLGAAFRSCLAEALKYDPVFVVTLDGSGVYDPGEIPGLLDPLRVGESDVVFGSRYPDNVTKIDSRVHVLD